MPAKRYKVTLSEEERQKLEQITKNGKSAAAKINPGLFHSRLGTDMLYLNRE